MTIQENTICGLIQTFPVLLILAQNHNKCLKTPLVYKPPSPTHSPEYYEALDALFQTLYGHEQKQDGHNLAHNGYTGHSYEAPCQHYLMYNTKKPSKTCYQYFYPGHGSITPSYSGHSYPSSGPNFPSYGGHSYPSYSHSYSGGSGNSYPSVSSHGYPSYGTQKYPAYGVQGSHGGQGYLSFKKGNIYDVNSNVSYGYAAGQGYTSISNNKYKVVVKKTRIGNKRKSGKLRAGKFN